MFETMCAVTLFGVVASVLFTVEGNLFRQDRTMHGYVTDLGECRRALRNLEGDLRGASRVEVVDGSYRIHTASGAVDYAVADGTLWRTFAGRRYAAGRRIEAVALKARAGCVDLQVTLQRRNAPRHVPLASVETSVFLRGGRR